ncbi:hypothetical protein C1Y40_02916 [Mycobacterium talmoniae]|uniref:NAD(P)-binding domain-containing protein n=1 Tax=Mycobacterium talmoniae TaxID=1858794 RepID=A0A2S8BJM5_9MYCO|nr:hypothetical protein C1Y40_02916 [Mycobacterium talmoniae]
MTGEIWVLGATGRVGREAAARLQQAGAEVVVAGRDRERLTQVSPDAGGGRRRSMRSAHGWPPRRRPW